MKRLTNYLTTILLVMLLAPAQLMAKPIVNNTELPVSPTSESAKIEAMVTRLNEIKEMDKSSLSSSEKRALRKEVRNMEDAVKSSGGGVYLSVGAVIIILLLLIIIL